MSELRQFPSICNFMMLTKKLYALFLQYIVDGRRRAPPVADLLDLVPSFQLGARTDRRALQSKFKSWARRMTVKDDKLMLASSNKEIIPLEKCDDLVMCIHTNGHKSIDQVISKVREKYTWTKKNFGMDRVMVMNYILRNCSNLECKRRIEMEISKRDCCDNFIKNVVLASEFQAGMFQSQEGVPVLKNSVFNNCSSLYPWPLVFPFTANSIPNEFCFPYNFPKTEVKDVATLVSNENKPYLPPLTPKNVRFENGIRYQSSKIETKPENIRIQKTSGPRKKKFGAFRKPKNINEFKELVRAAEQLNEAYPSILRDPKTTFLGGLDLAPKKICSKRTLIKFQKEKKRKSILEKQHLLYHKNRKNLRDRNKLNKIKLKQEQEKRAYLDASGSQKKVSSDISQGDCTGNERKVDDSEIEIVKVIPSRHEPEVILITSSDDEFSDDKAREIKSKSSKDIEVVKGDGKRQFSTSKKLETSEKDVEVVFNTGNSSLKDMNTFRITNQYAQHPILRNVLVPSNIKGEIAVLPFSRYASVKPFSQVYSSGNQDLNMKTPVKVKSMVLQPFSNTNIGNKPVYFNKFITGQHLPESKILLYKKTEDSDTMKTIPREQISAQIPKLPNQLNSDSSIPVDKNANSPTAVQKEKEKEFPLQKSYAKTSQNSSSKNESVHEEMSKLSKWIRKTKVTMARTYFNHPVERSIRKLESQLNSGITLIRSIRRKLLEMEPIDLKIKPEDA